MARRRNKRKEAVISTAEPSSGIMSRIVLPELRTSARSPYRDRKGEDNAMSVATNGTPNIYRNYRNGGTVIVGRNTNAEIATAHGTRFKLVTGRDPIFHSKVVDGVVFPRYFEAIRKNIPQVIPYGIFDVRVYFCTLQALVNQYCAWASIFALGSENVGTLADLSTAYREMFTFDDSAHPSDIEADLKIIKGALETFAFPDVLVNDAAWYYSPHRADPQEDAPVLMRNTGIPHGSFSSTLFQVSSNASGASNCMAGSNLDKLKSLVYNVLQDETLTKISADLTRTGMLSALSIPEFPEQPPFDLEWLDLWCNEGCFMDQTLISQMTVVPNGANDGNTERYQIPMKLLTSPTERFFRNLCFGFGKLPAEMFRPDHLNFDGTLFLSDSTSAWTKNGSETYVWHPTDPADAGSFAWNKIWGAIEGNSAGINNAGLVQLAKTVEYYCRGNLGYKAVLSVDHVASIDDEWEGMSTLNPLGGRRFWFDAVRFEEAALFEYLRILGV